MTTSQPKTAAPDTAALREKTRAALLARVARVDAAGRAEALTAFVGLVRPDLGPEAGRILAEKTPRLLPQLTEKWVGMSRGANVATASGKRGRAKRITA